MIKEKRTDNHILSGVYGMAVVGAVIYYVQQAANFWAGLLGILKAIFWPAVLMYKLLAFLKM